MGSIIVQTAPQVANCIYFANDNILSYHLDVADRDDVEKVIKTFPAGETISHIGNQRSSHLTVLTNSEQGWKLYGFPLIGVTPDIQPEPEFVYSGKGNARYLMYRD